MTTIQLLLVLCTMAFTGGCASARFVPTGSSYPPHTDDCYINVFSSKLPDRDYEELGVIEGEGSLGADTLEKILPEMKREACRAGGDAIILTSSQRHSGGEDHDEDKLSVTATVIRWSD